MNAIVLLTRDHEEVANLMDQIEDDPASKSARGLFTRLTRALTMHTQIEETIFYPALQNNSETREMISESLDEHQEVKDILAEMATMIPADTEFMDRLSDLKEAVENHVDVEENELFPRAEKIIGQSRLTEMGKQMQQMKEGKPAAATAKRI